MIREWTAHLKDQKQIEDFERLIRASKPVLDRFLEMKAVRSKSIEQIELSQKAFDNPNWAYKQAFMNGYKANDEIDRKYLTLDQEDTKNDRRESSRRRK